MFRAVLMRALVAFPLLGVATNANGGEKLAGASHAVKASTEARTSLEWCAPEYETLDGDTCVAGKIADNGPATLVIFLHGVIAPRTTWQWTQQLAMANATKLLPFVAMMPRGLQGVGPEGMKDFYAWPTSASAQGEVEDALLARFEKNKKELEAKQGRPFDEVFVVGFSNGAYFASSLALRGRMEADGFSLIAGGAKSQLPKKETPRAPIFVGVCTKDKTTRDMARDLAHALDTWHWPHRTQEEPIGHMFTPDLVARSIRYFRALKAK